MLGPLVYSGIFAFGMSLFTIWFVDAVNDVSWLFFHDSPAWVGLFLGSSWLVVFLLLFGAFFLLSLTIFYLTVRVFPYDRKKDAIGCAMSPGLDISV